MGICCLFTAEGGILVVYGELLDTTSFFFQLNYYPMSVKIECAYTKKVSVETLLPNPKNPNTHSPEQVAILAKVIKIQGWRSPIVVSKLSGFVVAGHGRLQAAKLLGEKSVPVDYQDFASESEEIAHLIADNRTAELSFIDDKKLAELLSELDDSIDKEATGFLDLEIAKLTQAKLESLPVEKSSDTNWTGAERGGFLQFNREKILLSPEELQYLTDSHDKWVDTTGTSAGWVVSLFKK